MVSLLVSGGTFLQHKLYNNKNYTTKNMIMNPLKCSSSLLSVTDNTATNICNNKNIEEECLKLGLKKEKMPQHVAILLDGSRRWHKSQGKPLSYDPFFEKQALFTDLCLKWGIGTASTFIYSFKNIQRGQETNRVLYDAFERYLENNLEDFIRKRIKVSMVGEKLVLPKSLQDKIKQVEETTRKGNTHQLEFMLAICYNGKKDIIQATRSISEKVLNGLIEPKAIDEALMDQELSTSGMPNIDLFIRTSGCTRVSNYMMWLLAYTELHFTNVSIPEFDEAEFIQALHTFQKSERLFGK